MNFLLNELRHCMTLQQRTLFKDQRGGFSERWETRAKIWAKLTPVISSQRGNPLQTRSNRLEGTEEFSRLYKVVTRVHLTIKKGMRLQGKGLPLFVLEEPFQEGGYQFFTVSSVLQSDGGSDE